MNDKTNIPVEAIENYLYIYRAEESKKTAEKEGWLTEEETYKDLV